MGVVIYCDHRMSGWQLWLDGGGGTTTIHAHHFSFTPTPQTIKTTRTKTKQLRLSPDEAADPHQLARRLRLHPAQRVLSRPVYAEEYEASLRECMVEGTPGAWN